MVGKVISREGRLFVEYLSIGGKAMTLPVISESNEIREGQLVRFDEVDEFSHPRLFEKVGLFEGERSALILNVVKND